MYKVFILVTILQAVNGKSLDTGLQGSETKAGFSVACQGPRSIGQMTKTAEIVTEAVVVDVSPARDNVYAVTLQVMKYVLNNSEFGFYFF